MESPIAYIPMDRRQALIQGVLLPDRTQGAALFADISGFTPLTEALVREMGPLRGAEELTRHLNLVYDALINELHCYGGSVIGFSGDAITCWLDKDKGLRATACALAMQKAMQQFSAVQISPERTVSLAMKAAVATGSVRRFLVGDPKIQVVEVLAGSTLDYLAAAEHHADRGEVLLDSTAMSSLDGLVEYVILRQDDGAERKFGVVRSLHEVVEATPLLGISAEDLGSETVRQWLLPPVYERLRRGQGEFLAEFRPALSVFVRFSGIDYDHDEHAGDKLDTYIRQVQTVLKHYEGSLIQLTMGDKGSYLQAAFGAPIAHEDDAIRAASAALEIRKISPSPERFIEVQIGIAHGRMRTGAYGGTTRRTYGVLGDNTNLAARLMQAAEPGQVLVAENAYELTGDTFNWEALAPIQVKGRSEPVVVFSLAGLKEQRAIRLQEPKYTLPMIGREAELDLIEQKLDLVLEGKGQIVGITAEAGMGKSRLVAEAVRVANQHHLIGYGGECQSYGTNTSYLVWQNVWRGIFNLDINLSLEDKLHSLERQLAHIDPNFAQRLPLLGTVLNLPIPDNELTRSFDAKLRKSSLEALLVDCLRAKAKETPLFLVMENIHWIDPLSHDLLEAIGRAIANLPVFMLMAYRPFDAQRWKDTRVSRLPHFTETRLSEFTQQEAEQLIQVKLNQFFGTEHQVPEDLVGHVVKRAEGNPFYIEELLNYLQEQGLDPDDDLAIESLDLPTSLHSLILTRIDQRTESQKITLKVASIVGRMFAAAWLWGAYPDLGEPERIKTDLDVLSSLDLTPLDTTEPELIYLFKHIVTQEVAYESLPFATRALLHDQLAQFIEHSFPDDLEQNLDLLAFHYERSNNEPKKREYLLKAGEAAQANYANFAAIDYYQKILPLLPETEKIKVMLNLGRVLELVGKWDEAEALYQRALEKAAELNNRQEMAFVQAAMGELLRKQGLYAEVPRWLDGALEGFEEVGDQAGVGQVLHYEGTLAAQQGELDFARSLYNQSLAIRRKLEDKRNIASLLNNLGIIEQYLGERDQSRVLMEEALSIRRSIGDRGAIQNSLNNLGNLTREQGNFGEARRYLEEAAAISQEIGDRWAIANSMNNLANVVRSQGEYELARTLYEKSLAINIEMEDKWSIAYLFEDLGCLAAMQGQSERALTLAGAADRLREEIGSPLPPAERAALDETLEKARKKLDKSRQAVAWDEGKNMSLEEAVEYASHG